MALHSSELPAVDLKFALEEIIRCARESGVPTSYIARISSVHRKLSLAVDNGLGSSISASADALENLCEILEDLALDQTTDDLGSHTLGKDQFWSPTVGEA